MITDITNRKEVESFCKIICFMNYLLMFGTGNIIIPTSAGNVQFEHKNNGSGITRIQLSGADTSLYRILMSSNPTVDDTWMYESWSGNIGLGYIFAACPVVKEFVGSDCKIPFQDFKLTEDTLTEQQFLYDVAYVPEYKNMFLTSTVLHNIRNKFDSEFSLTIPESSCSDPTPYSEIWDGLVLQYIDDFRYRGTIRIVKELQFYEQP